MLRFFMKHRGSVSILMAIILLPSLAAVSLLVDMANRSMSKAVVESAGELAVNSVLANYDTVLEDVYGLFANTQSQEDLKKNLKQYFADTLSAANLLGGPEYESQTMAYLSDFVDETIQSATSGVDNRVDVAHLSTPIIQLDVDVSSSAGASPLSTPAVLKGQIIEFMKYRGPAEVGMDLLGIVKSLQDMKKKADVSEKQMEVEEALSDLATAEKKFYEAIVECDKLVDDIEKALKELNWNGLGSYLAYAFLQILSNGLYRADLGSQKYPIFKMEPYDVNGQRIEGCYRIYKGVLNENGHIEYVEVTSSRDSGTNLGLVVAGNNKLKSPGLSTEFPADMNDRTGADQSRKHRIETFYGELEMITKDYALPVADYALRIGEQMADLYEERASYTDTIPKEVNDRINEELAILKANLESNASGLTNWYNIVNSGQEAGEIYAERTASVDRTVGGDMKEVWTILNPLYTAMKNAQEEKYKENFFGRRATAFSFAIARGKKVIELLDTVETTNDNLRTANENYESENGADEFSAKISSDVEVVDKQNTKEAVQEVVDQLQHIQNYLFGQYAYQDSSSDTDGLWTFVDGYFVEAGSINCPAADNELAEHPSGNAKIGKRYREGAARILQNDIERGYYDSLKTEWGVFSAFSVHVLVLKPDDEALTCSGPGADGGFFLHYDASAKNPLKYKKDFYLKKISESKSDAESGIDVGIPRYYVYLASTYDYSEQDKSSEGDNTQKNASKMADAAETMNKEKTGVAYSGDVFKDLGSATAADLTGDTEISADAEDKTGALKMVKELFSGTDGFLGALQSALEGARDNLLTTQYIYENFSNYIMAVEAGDNKPARMTMTNVEINKDNNVLFGCEVEYILYGERGDKDKGPEKNIDKVRNRIFLIRFLCNGIYALTNSEIQAMTIGPALAIQAATMGVFPYKVAQIVLDVCLALAESIYDVSKIMDGEKVVFIKTPGTWAMSASGAITAVTEAVVDKVADEVVGKAQNVLSEVSQELQKYVEQGMDFAAGEAEKLATSSVEAATRALSSALEDAVSGMVSVLIGEVDEIYMDILCEAQKITPEEITRRLTETVNGYITSCEQSGRFSSEVAGFLRSKSGTAVSFVLEANIFKNETGMEKKSVMDYLTSVCDELQKAGAVLNTQEHNKLSEALGALPGEFLKKYSTEINTQISGWIGGLQGEVTSYINSGIVTIENEANETVAQLGSEAADQIKSTLSDKINEYFPSSADLQVDGESMGGGGLSASIRFGYEDYLRLFLFLKVAGSDSDDLLTRTGEVITLNMRTGLKSYHTANGTKAKADFSMSNANTYVSVTAKVTVDPLLLNKDMVKRGSVRKTESGEYESVDYGRSDLWTYTFKTLAGY